MHIKRSKKQKQNVRQVLKIKIKIKSKFSSKKINRQRVLMALLLTVKMNLCSLKTNYYNFLWLEKWFIKSFSWKDKSPGVITQI